MLRVIMGNSLAKSVAIDFGIQWACWVVAAVLKTEKFYDLAGSSTFVLLTVLTFLGIQSPSTRQKVNSGMVIAWAVRLGTFLFTRVLKDGKDSRFDVVKHRPGLFWIYWTIQGVWVLSTLLPTLIVNGKQDRKDEITKQDYVGWGMWTVGFLIEVIADHQKGVFKNNPANAGKFITSGLWSVSRHPNYFGEILMWTGLYVSSTSVLRGWEHIGIISPLLLTYLLTRVSGIPLLEALGKKRWGNEPAYQEYVRNTAKLIPYIW
ncbi:delta(14)-sterol reductase [Aplysia californica]|uniref:Delta(14)-sterol reductase n=1 Tax=Aplysia californica TaxID=6500 RepID=A0ABM0JPN4_APLCA|nr:delta(14)-sterol reductase [Aplysia californica]